MYFSFFYLGFVIQLLVISKIICYLKEILLSVCSGLFWLQDVSD